MIQVLEQHISLAHYVVLLVALQNHLLVEYFNRVDGVLLFVPRGKHLSEASLANGAQKLEITRLDMLLLRWAQVDHFLAAVRGDGHSLLGIVIILDAVLYTSI